MPLIRKQSYMYQQGLDPNAGGGSSGGLGTSISGYYDKGSGSTTRSGSSRKVLDQAAINKLIYDVLSGDQGLAALAGAENSSGGYMSSTKGLMAQDLTAKIVGELANVTAETVTSGQENVSTKKAGISGKFGTVICTELVRQGLLSAELYKAGQKHFENLPLETVLGYQYWANPVVPFLAKNIWASKLILPIAQKRYEYIVHKKFTLTGWMTIWIAQPICYCIGKFLLKLCILKDVPHAIN